MMIIFASLEGPPISLFEIESAQAISSTEQLPIRIDLPQARADTSNKDYNPLSLSNVAMALMFITLTTTVVKKTTVALRGKGTKTS